jgi:hypothetical protein
MLVPCERGPKDGGFEEIPDSTPHHEVVSFSRGLATKHPNASAYVEYKFSRTLMRLIFLRYSKATFKDIK